MILTKKAIQLVKKNAGTRIKLAIALDCTDFTILRYLNSNSDNLTKAAAIKIIKKETGLSEKEILTEARTSKVV